jgi:hypothetical protein
MYDFLSRGAEYGSDVLIPQIRQTTAGDVGNFLLGKNSKAQHQITKELGSIFGKKGLRFAASKPAQAVLRFVPGLSAGLVALDAADVVAGDESLGNRIMDGAGMLVGGGVGLVTGGPMGMLVGAGTGKQASDGLQYLFGDKKTPEQRRMEEALAMLQGGRY